jgi:hypothetical protein
VLKRVEGIFVKRQSIYAALAVLALATPAAAQNYPAQAYPAGGLAPREVFSILRSTGLDPLGPPMRRGPNYVLRAVDENDREVRVVVNARSGDVLSVTPVQIASRMPPTRGGVTMGPYERMPPGYVPSDADRSAPPAGYRPGAPVADDEDDEVGYNNPNVPRPPGQMPGAQPPSRSSNAAPPPRGGAMPRERDEDISSLSEPNVITADPDRSGMLPPPPERFPQRAAPAAPPKPMKRTAAAPPKQAPLPKPKPAAKTDAPPAPAPQAQPQSAQPSAAPAEETPN